MGLGRIVLEAPFSDEAVNALLSGNTYIELRTVAYPDGEIRGQLVASPSALADWFVSPGYEAETINYVTWQRTELAPPLPGDGRAAGILDRTGLGTTIHARWTRTTGGTPMTT